MKPSEKLNTGKLVFVHSQLSDSAGVAVPYLRTRVSFTVSPKGAAEILGAGNGGPNDMQSLTAAHCRSFKGRAMVVLKVLTGNRDRKPITLVAKADGLPDASLLIPVTQNP